MTTLDEIQARADKATAGPWDCENLTSTDARDYIGPFGIYSLEQNDQGDLPPIAGYEDGGIVCADAEFIAHAREDVPRLLAALRAVEAVEAPTGDDYTFDLGYAAALDKVRNTIREALGA